MVHIMCCVLPRVAPDPRGPRIPRRRSLAVGIELGLGGRIRQDFVRRLDDQELLLGLVLLARVAIGVPFEC